MLTGELTGGINMTDKLAALRHATTIAGYLRRQVSRASRHFVRLELCDDHVRVYYGSGDDHFRVFGGGRVECSRPGATWDEELKAMRDADGARWWASLPRASGVTP